MGGFAYEAPTTLDAALSLLAVKAGASERTQVLAGGTDMLVQMRGVDSEPRCIVDIKGVPETSALSLDSDGLHIGAAVPAAVITRAADVAAAFPGLVEGIDLIGSTQIQGRASPGGNLCTASPAGDSIPIMIANGGVAHVASASGRREVPVEDFVVGVQRNCLQPGEMLVALTFPHPGGRSGDAYLRFIPRTEMDIAVASAGVRLAVDEAGVITSARVAIGAVAPTALLVAAAGNALVGTTGDDAALAALADACSAAANPISDKRGTAEYRRRVVGVLARRATLQALARARGVAVKGAHA
ncbi:MAG: xanthine dehydrogenase family protein subunit M [Pseudomonadota bacterium]|nr:xanthine dehydrogenase family protein subunit M [Pseudomonadota bacterium]